jgi:hypothetical protein
MFKTLSVSGFRGLAALKLSDLGAVNVLVGENGVGKTAVLEAFRFLGSGGNPAALLLSAFERGEYTVEDTQSPLASRVGNLAFAFNKRPLDGTSRFRIGGTTERNEEVAYSARVYDCSVEDPEAPVLLNPRVMDPDSPYGYHVEGMFPEWAVNITPDRPDAKSLRVPISWGMESARRLGMHLPPDEARIRGAKGLPTMLRASALDDATLIRLWDTIAARPEKQTVVETLRLLEPNVREIDMKADPNLPLRSRVAIGLSEGFVVPLGSLGEGATWIFALTLAAAALQKGHLLIDDIDAGLHHRTMDTMWRMVLRVVQERSNQLVATTHSIDCLRSLDRVCRENERLANEVRIIHLVRNGTSGILFGAGDLAAAIAGEIEVRG